MTPMRTKKAKPEAKQSLEETEREKEQSISPAPQETPKVEDSASQRVTVAWYVNPDGTIDTARMQSKTREMLRDFVTNPKTMEALGINKKEAAQAVAVFSEAWFVPIVQLLGTIQTGIAPRVFGVSPEIAANIFPYSDGEVRMITPALAAVVNKYAADWMIRFKEEISLAVMMVGITTIKISAARRLMEEQKQKTVEMRKQEETGEKEASPIQ